MMVVVTMVMKVLFPLLVGFPLVGLPLRIPLLPAVPCCIPLFLLVFVFRFGGLPHIVLASPHPLSCGLSVIWGAEPVAALVSRWVVACREVDSVGRA